MLKIFVGISAVQGALFAFIGFGLLSNIKNIALKSGIAESHPFFKALSMEGTFIYVVVLAGVFVTTMVFTWYGLKLSHDAVGAIYSLRKDMQKMAATKKLYQVKLRRNDFFKDFEVSFNEMVMAVSPHMDFEQDLDGLTPTPVPQADTKKRV